MAFWDLQFAIDEQQLPFRATRNTIALSPSSSVSQRAVIVGGGSLATDMVGMIHDGSSYYRQTLFPTILTA
jgi:hypothetical protein